MDGIKFSGAQVLVTGGSEGIGRELVKRLTLLGAKVAATGRRRDALDRLRSDIPGVLTYQADMAVESDRATLAAAIQADFPNLSVVINNAGFQRRVSLADDDSHWSERQEEINALLSGPIHLNHLLIPMLLKTGLPSLIVNVTSGGAFVPQPFAPIYSASKAGLHSYTMNLRYSLRLTNCRVVEVIPPAVGTGLGGTDEAHGVPVADFVDSVITGLSSGKDDELGFGMTDREDVIQFRNQGRDLFESLAQRFSVVTYDVRYSGSRL